MTRRLVKISTLRLLMAAIRFAVAMSAALYLIGDAHPVRTGIVAAFAYIATGAAARAGYLLRIEVAR